MITTPSTVRWTLNWMIVQKVDDSGGRLCRSQLGVVTLNPLIGRYHLI